MILKLEKELYKSQGYKDFYSSIYKQLILKHLTYRHLITFRPFCLQTQAIFGYASIPISYLTFV